MPCVFVCVSSPSPVPPPMWPCPAQSCRHCLPAPPRWWGWFPTCTAQTRQPGGVTNTPHSGDWKVHLLNYFTSFPLVGTTSGEVLVKDIPWGGRQWVWQDVALVSSNVVGEGEKNLHSQSFPPSGPAWSSSQQCHSGWNLKWWINSNTGV